MRPISKPTPLVHSEAEPFAHDRLGRKHHVENIANMLALTDSSLTIAIDGAWGIGKTAFVRFMESHLKSSNHVVLYYNAWDFDYIEDPLTALVGELSGMLKELETDTKLKKVGRRFSDVCKALAPLFLTVAAKKLTGLSLDEVKSLIPIGEQNDSDVSGDSASHHPKQEGGEQEGVKKEAFDQAAEIAKRHLAQHFATKNSIDQFKQSLAKYVEHLQEGGRFEAPLVIIIDELDRCKPSFAIRTLEIVKHIFDVPGVSFLIATNIKELGHCVQGTYGSAYDGSKYLQRFFDFTCVLDAGTQETLVGELWDKYCSEQEIFNSRNSNDIWSNRPRTIVDFVSQVTIKTGFSTRDVSNLFMRLQIYYRQLERGNPRLDILHLLFMAVLERLHYSWYNSILRREYDSKHLIPEMMKLFGTEFILNTGVITLLETACMSQDETIAFMEKLATARDTKNPANRVGYTLTSELAHRMFAELKHYNNQDILETLKKYLFIR